jgi:PAS domain S-box-containing protein
MADLQKPDWLQQTEGILETLNEAVLILDDCSRAIYVNEGLIRMTGYARADLLGKSPAHFWQGPDLEEIQRQIARSHREGHNRHEFFMPRADGGRVPAIVSTRVVEDLDGRQFEIISFTDITEQKRAEALLRDANARLQERQREIERDLALAARVQQSLAPSSVNWGPFHVEALYQPVSTIGGDFGAVTPLGADQLNLLVCDVSGHGISSALIANRIYSETMSLLERRTDLGEMLRGLNDFVLHQIQMSGFYFSMAVARLDARHRRMSFANAGHPPAIWLSNGESRLLESRSAVLGLIERAVEADPTQQVDLRAGDRVMLYTDGVSEVFNHQEELLGFDRLQEIARRSARLPLREMKQAVIEGISAWRHGPVTDDMSLVLIEVK